MSNSFVKMANVFKLVLLVFCVVVFYPQITNASPRIGIIEFKNETKYSYSDLSQNVEDLLINELVNTGKFDVVERAQMDKMLHEQRQGATGIIDPSKAAEFGKINGIQYLVYGRVVNATLSNSGFAFGGIALAQANVKVNIVVRVINTTTGSIAIASSATGSVTVSKGGLSGVGAGWQDVSEQDIQRAAEKAVKIIATDLAAKAANLAK